MIRQPTPVKELMAFYRAKLRGDDVVPFDGEIHCGWYKVALVKNGPYVPAHVKRISKVDEFGELTEDEYLECEINGVVVSDIDAMEKFTFFRAIPLDEYEALVERWRFMAGNPYAPIDLSEEPTLPKGYYFNA